MKTLVTQGLFAFSSSPAGTPFPPISRGFCQKFARNCDFGASTPSALVVPRLTPAGYDPWGRCRMPSRRGDAMARAGSTAQTDRAEAEVER